jgi:ketosteroid isomerase-like protein
MSQENVEIVRRIYASATRSVPGGVALMSEPVEHWKSLIDPGIEWCGPREFPDLAEPAFGFDGIVAYAAKVAEALDDCRMTPEQFIDAGDAGAVSDLGANRQALGRVGRTPTCGESNPILV